MESTEISLAFRDLLCALEGILIVSCQTPANHPMRDTETIARVAKSVLLGGAGGLRINGPEDIRAVRAITELPIIGLYKETGPRREVITIHVEQARAVADAGADIVAMDATLEVFDDVPAALTRAAAACNAPIMADISNLNEGLQAWDAGVKFVSTTLSGYTPYTFRNDDRPDIELVGKLAARGVRVIAEGRYSTPDEVEAAFDSGAFAVVVGGAITDPMAITRRFAFAAPRSEK
jgi:N-acylglucosamine-6-phosphate 2-epimerase